MERKFPTFGELLAKAQEVGLEAIETTVLQMPTDANGQTAVVRAVVRLKDGRQFSAHGDASPQNTRRGVDTALIRMAETRALGRALRFALGVAETLAEELPPEERPVPGQPARPVQSPRPQPAGPRPPQRPVAQSRVRGPVGPGAPLDPTSDRPAPVDGRGDDLPF